MLLWFALQHSTTSASCKMETWLEADALPHFGSTFRPNNCDAVRRVKYFSAGVGFL